MTTDTDRTGTTRSARPTIVPGFGRAILFAVVGAALAAAAVHLLFDALGADFVVQPPGQEENTVSVGLAAGVAALVTALGGAVAALLPRLTRRPSRVFLVLAVVVFALMFLNPLMAADQALTVVALELEHLAVLAVALVFLLPPLRARDRA
jgi:hypothetical protein